MNTKSKFEVSAQEALILQIYDNYLKMAMAKKEIKKLLFWPWFIS